MHVRKETVQLKAHLLLSFHLFVNCWKEACCYNEVTPQLSVSECTNRKKLEFGG